MFTKTGEREYENKYFKTYNYDCSLRDCINNIIDSNIQVEKVSITDNGDVGMKYFGGEYSYDDFLSIYDKLISDIDVIKMSLKNETLIRIYSSPKIVGLVTTDINLELEDLLKKNRVL